MSASSVATSPVVMPWPMDRVRPDTGSMQFVPSTMTSVLPRMGWMLYIVASFTAVSTAALYRARMPGVVGLGGSVGGLERGRRMVAPPRPPPRPPRVPAAPRAGGWISMPLSSRSSFRAS